MVFGGIQLAQFKDVALPQEVATAFFAVTAQLIGATYTPVLYVGSQLVNGTNYYVLAERAIVVPNAPKSLVCVVINVPPTSVGGKDAVLVKIDEVTL